MHYNVRDDGEDWGKCNEERLRQWVVLLTQHQADWEGNDLVGIVVDMSQHVVTTSHLSPISGRHG